MLPNRDKLSVIRVYTVCDESRYLIVRNVPALGCGDELKKLFGSYGEIEECKPMDAEDCEPFTDVYWIKFTQVSNAREHDAGGWIPHAGKVLINHVSSNSEYFPVPSMNETVKMVREKLDKIQSSSQNTEAAQASKRAKVDNRRRI